MKKLLLLVLLLALLMPALPVGAAGGSVVDTLTAEAKLYEYNDYILASNGIFWLKFYKGYAGYNVIQDIDHSVLVYEEQVVLEYLQDTNWKQRGVPTSIDYVESGEGYTVTRHYTDWEGTTYDVDYEIQSDKPIKVTVRLHSGQADTYRIVWSLSGITQSGYSEWPTKLAFDTVIFDWADVYYEWGNITSPTVTDQAQGKKADIAFNIGYVGADEDIVLDPSIVSAVESFLYGAYFPCRRYTFYAEGRHWVLVDDSIGSDRSFFTSTNAIDWSVTQQTGVDAYSSSLYYDTGTEYLHIVLYDSITDEVHYRRGVPQSDGTITWCAATQTVVASTWSQRTISVSVDTDGYPFIAYSDSDGHPHAISSTENDGTWVTDVDQEGIASSAYDTIMVVQLPAVEMYFTYADTGGDQNGRLWDGDAWGAQTLVADADLEERGGSSMASDGTYIYYVYTRDSVNDIYMATFTLGSDTWGVDELVYDTAFDNPLPAVGLMTNGDIVCAWYDNDAQFIYYIIKSEGAWGDTLTIDMSGICTFIYDHSVTLAYLANGGYLGIAFTCTAEAVASVGYAYLEDATAPTVTNSAADDITATTATLHGEITDTGGVNATNRGFEWDIDSGAPYANDWDEAGDFGTGVFGHGIAGLPVDTTIYWRAYATNSVDTSYSDERSFDTLLPLPVAPTNFSLTETGGKSNSVSLTWTKGSYANTTVIRGKEGSYPVSVSDGWAVYNGTGTSTTDTDLNLVLSTIHYRTWSYNEIGYSVDYAEGTIGGGAMLFLGLILLGGIVTGLAVKVPLIPIRMGAGLVWLALGIILLTSPGTIGAGGIGEPWVQALGFAFILLTVTPLLMQMKTDIRHEETVRGKRSTWSEWGKAPKAATKARSKQIQEDYRARLRERGRR